MKIVMTLVSVFLLMPFMANAQRLIDPTRSSCTGINCSSLLVPGSYFYGTQQGSEPYVAQLFTSGPNECLSIKVNDPLMVLDAHLSCAPGHFARRIGETSGPVLSFGISIGAKGFCTLTVMRATGLGPSRLFTYRYGRYNTGNENCR